MEFTLLNAYPYFLVRETVSGLKILTLEQISCYNPWIKADVAFFNLERDLRLHFVLFDKTRAEDGARKAHVDVDAIQQKFGL